MVRDRFEAARTDGTRSRAESGGMFLGGRDHSGRRARHVSRVVGILVFAALTFAAAPIAASPASVAPPPAKVATVAGSGDANRPNFDYWHVGDVHAHGAGDTSLVDQHYVGHPFCYGDEAPGGVEADSAEECAQLLVTEVQRIAEANELDFAFLTEHAAWLGTGGIRVPVCTPLFPSCSLVPLPNPDYDNGMAERGWAAIGEAANVTSRATGTHLLTAQELGTAGLISKGPDWLPYGVLFCGTVNSGHFAVYHTDEIIHDTSFDCEESETLRHVAEAGAWGGVNHPDNPDHGSQWHCWFQEEACNDRLFEDPPYDTAFSLSDIAGDVRPPGDVAMRSIEIISGNNQPTTFALDRWDQMLLAGSRIAAVGGSDTHTYRRTSTGGYKPGNTAEMGLTGRTLVYNPLMFPANSGFDTLAGDSSVREAIESGRTVATNGPKVVASIAEVGIGETVGVTSEATVRVDWEGETFPVLNPAIEEPPPLGSDPPRLDRSDAGPDRIRVVIGPQDFASTFGPPPTHLLGRRSEVVYDVTGADQSSNFAEIPISIPGGVDAGWVRVEAYYDLYAGSGAPRDPAEFPEGLDGERLASRYFAFTSPIYWESTSIEALPGCGAPPDEGPPQPQFTSTELGLPTWDLRSAGQSGSLAATAGATSQWGTLHANDDSSAGPISTGFPLDFHGTRYEFLYVNNNGTITFDEGSAKFQTFELSEQTEPMIAPFFADVDTRGDDSGLVDWAVTEWRGRPAFCALWGDGEVDDRRGVGYYDAHDNLRNTFQVILADRSDRREGDFDIVFNYENVEWESGDLAGSGGFGGVSAGAGYTAGDGDPNHVFEIDGSRDPGSFPDPLPSGSPNFDGIVHGSRGSILDGRYVFHVANGSAPGGAGTIGGTISSIDGDPVRGTPVQVCLVSGRCVVNTFTGATGHYTANGLPAGTYTVSAFPPSGTARLLRTDSEPIALASGESLQVDLTLMPSAPVPTGLRLDGSSLAEDNTVLVAQWAPFTVAWKSRDTGCSVTFAVTTLGGAVLIAGPVYEVSPGQYVSDPVTAPTRGYYDLKLYVTGCDDADDDGDGDGELIIFVTLITYIDPSGVVRTTTGEPVPGAQVTLLRADSELGPFLPVEPGNAAMSPANRANPSFTDRAGTYRWDVITGFYRVTATKPGCHAPGQPALSTVESPILEIPPPALDVDLVLECPSGFGAPNVEIEGISEPELPPDSDRVLLTWSSDTTGTFRVLVNAWDCRGGREVATGTVDAGATIQSFVPIDAFGVGVNSLSVCVRDAEFDEGMDEIDVPRGPTTPPVTIRGLDPPSDTGSSSEDRVTNATILLLSGQAGPLGQITLLRAGAPVGTTTAGPDGIWTIEDPGPIAEGSPVYEAEAHYPHGTSRSDPVGVTVDRTAPETVLDSTPTEAGALIELGTVDDETATFECSYNDGPFEPCEPILDLQFGSITARATDLAGNVDTTPETFAIAYPATRPTLAAGDSHSLAVDGGNTVAWGSNDAGQLGTGTTVQSLIPVPVPDLAEVVSVAAGERHSLALGADGTVWSWGGNDRGQLGLGHETDAHSPQLVDGLPPIVSIAAGAQRSFAIAADGSLWAWGANGSGQLGDGTHQDRDEPVEIELEDVTSVAVGGRHTLAVRDDRTVWAWGANGSGQLGDGTRHDRDEPTLVANAPEALSAAAGDRHSIVLAADGGVWAWGANASGQLGDGTRQGRTSPSQIANLDDMDRVAAGGNHSLAVGAERIHSWGANHAGQLGTGTPPTSRTLPAMVSSLDAVSEVAAGDRHSVARSDHELWAWGLNNHGQVGDGTRLRRPTPVRVGIQPPVGCTIVGTAGNDTLTGGSGDDVICGLGGDDILRGNGGIDTLLGGGGIDQLDGGTGDDVLDGGDGADELLGGGGSDSLTGGDGNDTLAGGTGDDTLDGGDGNDTLNGDGGHDDLSGGAGSDQLDGGDGNDEIDGAHGDDALVGGGGSDSLTGGDDRDSLAGGTGDDTLDGGEHDDSLAGDGGHDDLSGGGGSDQLNGGSGIDRCLGETLVACEQ